MRIVFKNSALVFAKSVWSATGKLIKVYPSEATSVNLPSGAKVCGRNLADASKSKFFKILNDSGVEVSDSSSYFAQYIPAMGETIIRTNYALSRVYLYDIDKNLLGRPTLATTEYKLPAQHNGKDVAYFTIQTKGGMTQEELNHLILTMGEDSTPSAYEEYKENSDGVVYSPYSWVWADDLREITITEK